MRPRESLLQAQMIRIENLVKAFGAKRAVDGVSFAVERGEVLGFLGPNGAGKSTTMRMITGFFPPTSAPSITVAPGTVQGRIRPAARARALPCGAKASCACQR